MGRQGWIFSGTLHAGVIAAAVLGLPSMFASDNEIVEEAIIVSVISEEELSGVDRSELVAALAPKPVAVEPELKPFEVKASEPPPPPEKVEPAFAAVMPEPEAIPEPEIIPESEPIPEPDTVVKIEPPAPKLEPIPQPDPVVKIEPPAPKLEPIPQPEPVAKVEPPEPKLEPIPEPDPVVKVEPPEPKPEVKPKLEPALKPLLVASIPKPHLKPAPAQPQPSFDSLLKSVVDEALEKPPEPKMPEFNKLLASVADAPPTTPDIKEKQQTRTSTMDMALANLVAKEIKAKVEKNWSVPAGVRDAGEMIVTIRIRLRRDGKVESADILDDNYDNDANFRTMVESARRAVLKASPFLALRSFSDDYDQWRDVTMTFRPPV